MISSGVNLVMTVIGFAVSTMFIVFVCTRLICARIHLNASRRSFLIASRSNLSLMERGYHGLERIDVNKFPIKNYSDKFFAAAENSQCTVCLSEYQDEDILRILPYCGHSFHVTCIDLWLQQNATCPVCRISLREFSERKRLMQPLFSSVLQPHYGMESFDSHHYHCMMADNELSPRTPDSHGVNPIQEDHFPSESGGAVVMDSITSKCRTINCFTAEAIALRDAVSLARNMDMDRVIFESDCLDLVKAVGLLGRLVKAMKWLILLLKWLALALFLPPGPGIAQFILRGLLIKIALQQEDKGSASVVCWVTGCDVVFKIHCFTLGLAWVGVVFSAVLYPGRSGAFVAGLVVVLRIFDPMDLDISSFEIILRPPCGFPLVFLFFAFSSCSSLFVIFSLPAGSSVLLFLVFPLSLLL